MNSGAFVQKLLRDRALLQEFLALQTSCESGSLPADAREITDAARTLRVLAKIRGARGGEIEAGFEQVVLVSFRGSQNLPNWIANFTPSLVPLQFEITTEDVRVHQGFRGGYLQLREGLKTLFSAWGIQQHRALILMVGHSLGGALATLGAYDAASDGFNVHLITMGAPRVGNSGFRHALLARVPCVARFVIDSDVVPRLPVNTSDPNSDGAAVHDLLASGLMRLHQNLQVAEYEHICPSTKVSDGKILSAVLSGIVRAAADRDRGAEHIQQSLAETHLIDSYVRHINALVNQQQQAGFPQALDIGIQLLGSWLNRQSSSGG
eukprot:TRINITY_DN62267_c0_g1_i1.p1 TRINITY_DN62267_c0_g1~~TRINITY_DN62267_c0_g1_i1.p1  ORF type:complete len:353 (+),score=45.31 TRINITY_DN62267_c0_g1_i1:96-1061(+)